MMSFSTLPENLLGGALKTTAYILNWVPSKAVQKIPFEIWTSRKPSLSHFPVWGGAAEAKVYNPNEKKLDPRTASCFIIGYLERSKGYRFYCPFYHTRIVETSHARFLENDEFSGSSQERNIIFQEVQDTVPIPSGSNYLNHPIPTCVEPITGTHPLQEPLSPHMPMQNELIEEVPHFQENIMVEPVQKEQAPPSSAT